MRAPFLVIFLIIATASFARADKKSAKPELQNLPVEITASGGTTYENGLAIARDDVAIHVGDTDIYSDYAEYNSQTRDIRLKKNVRIYRAITLYVGEEAVYNIDTKQIRAVDMRTDYPPYFTAGQNITSASETEYLVKDGTFTTHDSSDPDFHLRARSIRIYEKDRIVFQNVTFYVGKVPIFWWPYLYQSLDDSFSILVSPAYLSSWGYSLLGRVSFPITEKIKGTVHLDYRSRRGAALGFDADVQYGKDDNSSLRVKSYYIQDQDPGANQTSIRRVNVPTGRYRLSLENRTNFDENDFAIADVTKLSDAFVLEDFYQSEFRVNPQPEAVVALTHIDPFYTLTAIGRFEVNSFFEQTERLPEVVLDIKRHGIFGGPIFYEGNTGVADLRRTFARGSGFEDYGTFRFDSFHQLLYPNTYFGFLSVIPRIGVRGTYYSETRDLGNTLFTPNPDPLIPDFLLPDPTLAEPLHKGGGEFRTLFNAGVEASFKVSREWEGAQSRMLGLDGLRHVIQPFTNLSYVSDPGSEPASILQFDRYQPSTQLRPIDFPQFTSVDSIDKWTIWRLGVRNRLQTRRDDSTINWLEMETYFDVNFENPYDKTQYSNLFNKLRFSPVPWAALVINSQIPAFDKGFTEVNTNLNVQPLANLQVNVGHRYLADNPFFGNSSQYVVGGYYRLNDNWGAGMQQQYEATTHTLQEQRYSVYRDLSSWVGSLGAVIRDNGGVKEYGVLVTFTLKAFPKISLDFNVDPGAQQQ